MIDAPTVVLIFTLGFIVGATLIALIDLYERGDE